MTVAIKGRTELIITMRTKPDELDEVTVVAFAKQKKESVIASVSTVNPQSLKSLVPILLLLWPEGWQDSLLTNVVVNPVRTMPVSLYVELLRSHMPEDR